MSLPPAQKKAFRSIGHHLDPIVTVSENGLSEGVMNEIDRALTDHELIKIKLAISDRETRQEISAQVVQRTGAELIQSIGKMALVYRRNPKAKANLSNVARYSEK
ncbi:ribosome assembly RNA-binding protein YhbY [Halomonas shantousis]